MRVGVEGVRGMMNECNEEDSDPQWNTNISSHYVPCVCVNGSQYSALSGKQPIACLFELFYLEQNISILCSFLSLEAGSRGVTQKTFLQSITQPSSQCSFDKSDFRPHSCLLGFIYLTFSLHAFGRTTRQHCLLCLWRNEWIFQTSR